MSEEGPRCPWCGSVNVWDEYWVGRSEEPYTLICCACGREFEAVYWFDPRFAACRPDEMAECDRCECWEPFGDDGCERDAGYCGYGTVAVFADLDGSDRRDVLPGCPQGYAEEEEGEDE